MKLVVKCKSCQEEFEIKEQALTRSELEDKIGNYFERTCPQCDQANEYHVNEVKAIGGNTIKQAGRIAAMVIAVGAYFFSKGDKWLMGLGLFIAGAIFFGANRMAAAGQSNVEIFNSILVKDKRKAQKEE